MFRIFWTFRTFLVRTFFVRTFLVAPAVGILTYYSSLLVPGGLRASWLQWSVFPKSVSYKARLKGLEFFTLRQKKQRWQISTTFCCLNKSCNQISSRNSIGEKKKGCVHITLILQVFKKRCTLLYYVNCQLFTISIRQNSKHFDQNTHLQTL